MIQSRQPVTLVPVSPESAEARGLMRAYFDDILSRAYGRRATGTEIDAVLHNAPSDDLAPPHGLFLVARQADTAVACAGLLLLPPATAEIRRVYTAPPARGQGIGALLLQELETRARELGVTRMRLDTRDDLVEARRMYARFGYEEVPAFNDDPHVDHWLAKTLS
ncbi:GNAT family N-acetyltransferase [Streptomyces sp. RKAG293]|uniref:GNAT family N-acetyltransferase n=1 Tax=Streptomyces sp. RKAG293 TaxID=2893403 RepID=UPI00203434C4|nr:GNAT family N-acetyltransferase [Streptomyces sp. RKAG293]MCM2423693.1 GNAT family N-acetyltransferase [Streptomyces sp. RKAG293]